MSEDSKYEFTKVDYEDDSKIKKRKRTKSKGDASFVDEVENLIARGKEFQDPARILERKQRKKEVQVIPKNQVAKSKRVLDIINKRGINLIDFMRKIPALRPAAELGRWMLAREKARKVNTKMIEQLDRLSGAVPSLERMTDKRLKREIKDYVAGKTRMSAKELNEIKKIYPDIETSIEDLAEAAKFAEKKGKDFKGKLELTKKGTSPLTRIQKELTGLSKIKEGDIELPKDRAAILEKIASRKPGQFGASTKKDTPLFGKGEETFNLATAKGEASAFRQLKALPNKEIALRSLKSRLAFFKRQLKDGKKEIKVKNNKTINVKTQVSEIEDLIEGVEKNKIPIGKETRSKRMEELANKKQAFAQQQQVKSDKVKGGKTKEEASKIAKKLRERRIKKAGMLQKGGLVDAGHYFRIVKNK